MSQTTYEKTTWEAGSTALSAENFNHLEQGVEDAHEMLANIFNAIYPVGSIYMSAELDTPAKVMEKFGGTWVAWGSGRVPVGVDTSQTEFDTVEETGGAKSVTLTAAQSGVPAHSHGLNSHKHTYAKPNANTGSHTLTINEIPSHDHVNGSWNYQSCAVGGTNGGVQRSEITYNSLKTDKTGGGGGHTHTISTTSTDSGAASGSTANNTAANASSAHNNLQPYITCFMYKRTE